MTQRLVSFLSAAVVLTLLTACSDDAEEDLSAATDNDTTAGASTGLIDLTADDYVFSPESIEAPAGDEVTVAIFNQGAFPHSFTIDSLEVDVEVAPGEQQTVSFTSASDVQFYCRFHQSLGMEGAVLTGVSGDASGSDADPTEEPPPDFGY